MQGTERKPYNVIVDVSSRQLGGKTTVTFAGRCSCYLGGHCKHSVAVLLHVLQTVGGKAIVASALPASAQADKPLLDWLERVKQAAGASPSANDYPEDVRFRAIYVVSLEGQKSGRPRAVIAPHSFNQTVGGRPSQISTIRASSLFGGIAPKYYREIDKSLLSLLWASAVVGAGGATQDQGRYPLAGEFSGEILRLILESGRGRWGSLEGPALIAGAPRAGQARWETEADGTQRFRIDAGGGDGTVALILTKTWYADLKTGEVGPLDLDVPPHLLQVLLAAPPVPPPLASRLRPRAAAEPARTRLGPAAGVRSDRDPRGRAHALSAAVRALGAHQFHS